MSTKLTQQTTIVMSLHDFCRQRLSGIRRGWCRPGHENREGDPFRLWRRSPPVVKCAGFIGGGLPSQGETTEEKAPRGPAESPPRRSRKPAKASRDRP